MNEQMYLMIFNEDHGDEMDVPATKIFTQDELEAWRKKVLHPHAYLGNMSDGFMQSEQGWTGEQFITAGLVIVEEVSFDFATTYEKLDLENLSLCDIFEED
jgi:hypothetical protein